MMHCSHFLLSLFICLTLSTSKETIPSRRLPLQRRKIGISAVRSSVFQWYTKVTIGGQSVILELDTGSSFLWVLDRSLTTGNSSTLGTYDPSKSRTVGTGNGTFYIKYGGGDVQGPMITETVTIGGLTFEDVPMGVGNTTSPFFLGQPFIGILGLGPQPTNAQALQVPFPISSVQSFALDFKTVGSDGSASIEFSGIDHSKYTGQLTRVPLNTTGNHWAIDNVGFSIGNVSMKTHEQVILDSGAGHNILAPASVVEAYYSKVPGAILAHTFDNSRVWLVPCNAKLPYLSLHIGNGTATVPGAFMIGTPLNESSFSPPGAYCNPSLQHASAQPSLLGFPFFASNYAVFDRVQEALWFGAYV